MSAPQRGEAAESRARVILRLSLVGKKQQNGVYFN